MRHKVAGYKLGRNTSHRRSLFRNMVTSMIMEERIETTAVKAKAMRPLVEKMITLGKKGDSGGAPSGRRLSDDRRSRHQAVRHRRRRVSATARVATCALSAPRGAKAMAPTRRSSNCSAANRCSTKSVRSVPKSAPSVPKKPARRWKKPKPSRAPRNPSRTRAEKRKE